MFGSGPAHKALLGDAFTDLSQDSGPVRHPPAGLLVAFFGLREKRHASDEII